jgi:hypothetical protein
MQRFRSTWLALIGGALLVTLSISAAFGAAPANTREATRGQTIAAFVHELIFGADEAPEEEAELEEEQLDEEDADALQDPQEDVDEETEEAEAHGECVSEIAQDPEAIGGVNETHGGAVSEAARVSCWEPAEDPELADPEEDSEEDLEEADAHGACVSAVARDETSVGGTNGNHGGAVSEAARETCPADAEEDEAALDESDDELDEAAVESDKAAAKAEKKAAKEAARTEQGGGKPTWAGTGGDGGNANAGNAKANHGGGNGRGGGRP